MIIIDVINYLVWRTDDESEPMSSQQRRNWTCFEQMYVSKTECRRCRRRVQSDFWLGENPIDSIETMQNLATARHLSIRQNWMGLPAARQPSNIEYTVTWIMNKFRFIPSNYNSPTLWPMRMCRLRSTHAVLHIPSTCASGSLFSAIW